MAVFTPIDQAALQRFLAHYRLGHLLDFAGIPSGITNTNYYVTTEQGEYVLTLFEQLTAAEITFFLELTAVCRTVSFTRIFSATMCCFGVAPSAG